MKRIFIYLLYPTTIDINDSSYKLINLQKKGIKEKIDNFAWHSLKEYNFDVISKFDFSFNYVSNLSDNYSNENKINLSNEIYRLLKNRLRYECVKSLKNLIKVIFVL